MAAYSPQVDAWIGIGPAPPVPDVATRGRDVVRDGNGGYDPARGEFDLHAFLAAHEPPRKPSMTITTDTELWYPIADVRQVWDWLPAPKRFVVLAHTGFNVSVADVTRSGTISPCTADRSSASTRMSRRVPRADVPRRNLPRAISEYLVEP